MATLYMDLDGVLHPRLTTFATCGRLPRLRGSGHSLFENTPLLEQALASGVPADIVLHSCWVPLVGLRRTLAAIPESIRRRVIGATCPGNRRLGFTLTSATARRDWLRLDLARRCAVSPVLLDCDYHQVLPMLKDCACIVDPRLGLATPGASDRLIALLRLANLAESDAVLPAPAVLHSSIRGEATVGAEMLLCARVNPALDQHLQTSCRVNATVEKS